MAMMSATRSNLMAQVPGIVLEERKALRSSSRTASLVMDILEMGQSLPCLERRFLDLRSSAAGYKSMDMC
jgi:hypothetical protein